MVQLGPERQRSLPCPAEPPAELPVEIRPTWCSATRCCRGWTAHGQRAWLAILSRRDATPADMRRSPSGVSSLRPFVTDPSVLGDLERDGISDRPAAGGTIQTTRTTPGHSAEPWFDVLAYVEGGVGNEHDLIVLRKP